MFSSEPSIHLFNIWSQMENVDTEKGSTGGRGTGSSCATRTPGVRTGVGEDVGGVRGGRDACQSPRRRPASHSPGATHQPHVPHNVTLPRLTQREHRKRGGAEAKEGRELGMGRGRSGAKVSTRELDKGTEIKGKIQNINWEWGGGGQTIQVRRRLRDGGRRWEFSVNGCVENLWRRRRGRALGGSISSKEYKKKRWKIPKFFGGESRTSVLQISRKRMRQRGGSERGSEWPRGGESSTHQRLSGENLQQRDQVVSISQVLVQVGDVSLGLQGLQEGGGA